MGKQARLGCPTRCNPPHLQRLLPAAWDEGRDGGKEQATGPRHGKGETDKERGRRWGWRGSLREKEELERGRQVMGWQRVGRRAGKEGPTDEGSGSEEWEEGVGRKEGLGEEWPWG